MITNIMWPCTALIPALSLFSDVLQSGDERIRQRPVGAWYGEIVGATDTLGTEAESWMSS